MKAVKLAASILSADFGRLAEQAREALEAGADWLHVDVMDGHFVPNLTVGPAVVEALRPLADDTGAWLDVHLMIERPERWVATFASAGASIVTVHVEASRHLQRTVQAVKEAGARAGVTLNPATPLGTLEEILPEVDLVLVMSVNPGFGGQAFLPGSTDKVRRLREMLDAVGATAWLEVDGGVTPANAGELVAAGATVLVAGNSVFGGERSVTENVRSLRAAASGAEDPASRLRMKLR